MKFSLDLLPFAAILACVVAACATPNPRRPSVEAAQAAPSIPQATGTLEGPPPSEPATKAETMVSELPPAARESQSASVAPAAAQTPPSGDPLVAIVAGRPVYVSELLAQWVHARNYEVLKQLDNLAVARIVAAEAQRLGVSVPPSMVIAAAEESVAQLEAEVKKKNPKLGFDSYVDRVLGLDPIRYRERLRDDALRQLLADRAARAWLLGTERREVRILLAKDESVRDAAQKLLAEGRDFSEVARQHSMDPSGTDGGRIPPVVRSEAPISKLAFSAEMNKVAGPIQESGRWLFLIVDAQPPVVVGTWEQVASQVEADLGARAMEELEIAQWRAAMQGRYEVDFQPFLRLVGQLPR
jgi:hypothetical protein